MCKYYIAILDTLVGSSLDMPFLLFVVTFTELHEKPFFLCHFCCCFLRSVPPRSQVMPLLNGSYKIHNIAFGPILRDDIMRERWKM